MTSTSEPERRMPGWIWLLGAMTLLGPISIDMYLPGFELIQQTLRERGVERTLSGYLIGVAVGQLVYGPMSDRFGRKPPLYVALVLYTAASIGCALASSMSALITMRVVQALGGCAGMVIARAIVRDRCQPHEAARVLSILMLLTGVGPIFAPLAGGWIVQLWGWRATFVAQALLGFSLLIAIHYVLTETRARDHREFRIGNVWRDYVELLHNSRFMGYSLIAAFLYGSIFCYLAGAPTVLPKLYGLTPQDIGWLMALNGIGFIFAGQVNLRWLRKRNPADVLARAVWLPPLLGCAFLAMSFMVEPSLVLIITVPVALVISIGLINPNIAALALAPHGNRAGTASALFGASQSVGTTLAGIAVGAVNDGTLRPLAALMLGSGVATVLTYAWAARVSRPLL